MKGFGINVTCLLLYTNRAFVGKALHKQAI